jgi:hypothetical protein
MTTPYLTRLFVAGCAAISLLVSGSSALAQEASPTAVECVSPGLPPGTPTPPMEASPVAEEEAMVPVEASPVAGTPADEATTAAVIATVENYVACYNTGDASLIIPLESEKYRLSSYGSTNAYDAVAAFESEPPSSAELVSAENVMTYPDGRVSAEIEVILGGHNFLHETAFFAQDMASGIWQFDEEVYLTPEPEGDSTVIGVTLGSADDPVAVTPNAPSVIAWPVVIFHVANASTEELNLAVLQLPAGADPAGLMDGSLSFDQITVIGFSDDLAPGEEGDVALVNLEPGDYFLVTFGSAGIGSSPITVTAPA